MAVDILILELPQSDRDLNISVPIYLELKRRGYNVVLENLVYSYYNLVRYKPKLVFFSSLNDSVVLEQKKLLHELGVPVVSMTTEGNFHDKGFHGYFWGWNKDYKFYQDVLLLWNQLSKELITKYHPEFESRLVVTGSVGHDRYKNLPFISKNAFLSSQNYNFKKVIGLAGFGLFKYIDLITYVETVDPDYPIEQFALFEKDRDILRKEYLNLVKNNPDTLFIARVHPELAFILHKTEFSEIIDQPNVFLSSVNGELKNIDDVINICDLWIAYESNTSLEAWLLDKPVLYFNPTTADFQRENHHKGVVIRSKMDEIQDAITEFYATGKIAAYEALKDTRQKILLSVVGYDDGKNYKRSADYIEKYFRKVKDKDLSGVYRKILLRKKKQILKEIVWRSVFYRRFRKLPQGSLDRLKFGNEFALPYKKKYATIIKE
jgi:hypothetical protein